MARPIYKDTRFIILSLFFSFFFLFWLFLQISPQLNANYSDIFSDTYGIMALIGFFIGIKISKKWGGYKSYMGRAIIMFSLGLLAQSFGQFSYTYYAYIQKIDAPYPSIGDIGYFGSIPLYTYGVLLLAQAAGVNVVLKSTVNQVKAFLIMLLILIASYIFFLQKYDFTTKDVLTLFFDFGYPLGQSVYLSLSIITFLLSRKILGGIMKDKILVFVIALLFQYFSDFIFLYQINQDVWTPAGINDFMYLVSYFIMILAVINLRLSSVKGKLATK